MSGYMRTYQDLIILQSLPLEVKIEKTKLRIKEWYEEFNGNVYISFSGGKDSTVLLDIARYLYPDIKAVFVDTGLEYPELRKFVKTIDNVEWIKPEKNFKEVINEYGWNFPSKDVAQAVYYARNGSTWAINKLNGLNKDGTESDFKKRYKKYQYLVDAPFKISNKCCLIMKEKPFAQYHKRTGLYPINATMTNESVRRRDAWLHTGCNAFDANNPISKPMSFWDEQDILRYLKDKEVLFCSVYGDIVEDEKGKLSTTGEKRTGCMWCPVGSHLDKVNKYQRMKITHPKVYDYCMRPTDDGGLGMKSFLDYIKVPYQ